MAQSSIINILTISFPEAIIIILMGLISIGRFGHIRNKSNIIKILFIAILSSVLSYFIRKVIDNEIENILISFIVFTLLYIFVLRLTVYESAMASLLSLIVFAVAQTVSIMLMGSITKTNFEDIVMNNLMLFIFVIPERVIEILLIYFSLKYEIKIIDFEKESFKKRDFYIQMFVYIICICTLVPLMMLLAKTVIYNDLDSIIDSTNSLLIRLNIYLTIFVTIVLTIAIKNTSDYYKNKHSLNTNELKQNLEYISSLLDEKNYDELKDAVDKLSERISRQ